MKNNFNLYENDNTNLTYTEDDATEPKVHPVAIVAIVLSVASLFLNILMGGLYVCLAGVVCGIIGLIKGGKVNKILSIIAIVVGAISFAFFVNILK